MIHQRLGMLTQLDISKYQRYFGPVCILSGTNKIFRVGIFGKQVGRWVRGVEKWKQNRKSFKNIIYLKSRLHSKVYNGSSGGQGGMKEIKEQKLI